MPVELATSVLRSPWFALIRGAWRFVACGRRSSSVNCTGQDVEFFYRKSVDLKAEQPPTEIPKRRASHVCGPHAFAADRALRGGRGSLPAAPSTSGAILPEKGSHGPSVAERTVGNLAAASSSVEFIHPLRRISFFFCINILEVAETVSHSSASRRRRSRIRAGPMRLPC